MRFSDRTVNMFIGKKLKFSAYEAARVFGMHPADFQRVARRWGVVPDRDGTYHRSDLISRLYYAQSLEVSR